MEDSLGAVDDELRGAILALRRALHLAAQEVRDELHAVADAEHRHADLEDAPIHGGRTFLVDARRAAGEDDRARLLRE